MWKNKIIVNPISGNGTGLKIAPLVQEMLLRYGISFSLSFTERPWHATYIAQDAATKGYENVIAVGGDGTANEVINGLMAARSKGKTTPALGIISVGRGNDMAYGMNIPTKLEEAVAILAEGKKYPRDIAYVKGGNYPKGRFFANGVGIGFDAVVSFESTKIKRITGFANYIAAAMKTLLLYYHAPNVRLEYNGGEIIQPCLMISIMNGRRMGGGFFTAPQSITDDGLFDICIAGQVSRLGILGMLFKFMKATQANHPAIKTDRTKHILVTAIADTLPAHADGEAICKEGTKLELGIVHKGLEIICRPGEPAFHGST